MPSAPKPVSYMHAHAANVLFTELESRREADRPLRILDMGCGPAVLTSFLAQRLPDRLGCAVEVHGVDVKSHAGRHDGYLTKVLDRLNSEVPGVPWDERIAVLAPGEPWPHEPSSFDAIVSNQVLEHVQTPEAAFADISRCLREDGIAVHLFPTRECLWEDHVKVPFAHRIDSDDLRTAWIRTWSKLKLSSGFRAHQRERGVTAEQYAEYCSDYLRDYTNHLSFAQYARLSKANGLRASLRYTEYMGSTFLRYRGGQDTEVAYQQRTGVLPTFARRAFMRSVGVTLFLHKRTTSPPPRV